MFYMSVFFNKNRKLVHNKQKTRHGKWAVSTNIPKQSNVSVSTYVHASKLLDLLGHPLVETVQYSKA